MAPKKKHPINPLQNASSQTECKFMALPAELRNRIYDLAFNNAKCVILTSHHNMENNRPPGILTSCKIIYAEARQLYNNNCEFFIYKPSDLRRWLEKIGSASRKSLRRLALVADEQTRRSNVVAKEELCRLDHVLQSKDVTMELGAVRVLTMEKWWCWELDEDGRKRVVQWRVRGGVEANE